MKAAVMYKKGELPQHVDFPEPVTSQEGEIVVSVKAVAVSRYERARATGEHYSSDNISESGSVIGGDGVFILEDGTRVYGIGVSGTMAEKAIIHKDRTVKIPNNLDDFTAAALPNAVIGAAMGLRFKADIQSGDVVLINGATGFTGRVAVQLARYYGAKKIIVTGRSEKSLKELVLLGADQTISLLNTPDNLAALLKQAHAETPFNVIIDYLWGQSAQIILASLKGKGTFTPKTRFVSVGSLSGELIRLSASNLRSVDLHLSGSGIGAWSKHQVHQFISTILPETLQLAAEGKLKVETVSMNLENVEHSWNIEIKYGKRLVIAM